MGHSCSECHGFTGGNSPCASEAPDYSDSIICCIKCKGDTERLVDMPAGPTCIECLMEDKGICCAECGVESAALYTHGTKVFCEDHLEKEIESDNRDRY